MTRDQIFKSARKLDQPSDAVTAEFAGKRDQLSAMAGQKLIERPDMDKLIGQGNQQMAEDNNRNFARFMESVFTDYQPDVLVETVLWVFRAYRAHGFQTTYWATNLNIWVDLLKDQMSADTYQALYPFYHWLIVNIPVFVKLSDDAGEHASSPKAVFGDDTQ